MFAIEEGIQKINGVVVDTYCREAGGTCAKLEVEAGTTGYMDGAGRDSGGRTYFSIICKHGDFHFEPVMNEKNQIVGMKAACCGDGGLDAVMKALAFAHDALNDQRCEVED